MLTDGLATGRLQLGGWFLGEDRDTPYDGSDQTPNPLQERTSVRVWLFTGDARLTKSFGMQVTATLPDVTRSAVVFAAGSTVNFSETFRGIGDTSVVAWHRSVTAGWHLTLNGGISIPTGKTEQPRFRPDLDEGSLVPISRLQRGTGTFDPLFGVYANRVFLKLFPPGTRVFASAAARVPVAENDYGLRTGASWEIGAGGSREIHWHYLIGIARLAWLHREQDVMHGTPILVGGGDWLSIAPAVAIAMGKFTLQTEFKLPIYRSLDNRQLDASWAFQSGVVWSVF